MPLCVAAAHATTAGRLKPEPDREVACSFEVETDGDSIDILDVSLDKMSDENSLEEQLAEEEDDEEVEEDEESVYGGPVSRPEDISTQNTALKQLQH